MGLSQYSYNESDEDWFATFLNRAEKQSKGYNGASLTNYDTTTECAIASGSVLEINGAMFIASVETTVTGSIATGLNYILLSVTGTSAAPYWSASAPTWDDTKVGYYSGTDRGLGGCYSDSDLSSYKAKWIYYKPQNHVCIRANESLRPLKEKVIEIGDWVMSTTDSVNVAHGLGSDYKKIRNVDAVVRSDDNDLYYRLTKGRGTDDPRMEGFIGKIATTTISLYITTASSFIAGLFNSSSYNRGWIYVAYADGE